jgi:hypothetical protein
MVGTDSEERVWGEESERDWGTFEIDEYEREGVLTLQIPADALHPPLQ